MSEVLGECTPVPGLTATQLAEESIGVLGKSVDLLLGGSLVLVHELAEHATGTDIGGVTPVSEVDDLGALGPNLVVDPDLVGLVGDDHSGDNLDVATETSLLLLDLGGQGNDLGGEVLAGMLDILGSSEACGLDVLHGGREASVGKSRLLGELVVEVGNGGTEVAVEMGTVLGHLLVHLAEAAVGPLAGSLDTSLDSLHDLVVASSRGGADGTELDNGSLAGSLELGVDRGSVGPHLSSNDGSVLLHLSSMSGDVLVGLLDLLRGLLLEGKESTLLSGNGVTELVNDVLLVPGNAVGEGGTSGGTLLVLMGETLVQSSELGL